MVHDVSLIAKCINIPKHSGVPIWNLAVGNGYIGCCSARLSFCSATLVEYGAPKAAQICPAKSVFGLTLTVHSSKGSDLGVAYLLLSHEPTSTDVQGKAHVVPTGNVCLCFQLRLQKQAGKRPVAKLEKKTLNEITIITMITAKDYALHI